MPKVAYYGPHPSVDLVLDDGAVTVEHGKQVEVSGAVRDDLVKQGDGEIWREVKTPDTKSTDKDKEKG